jgi:cyclic pyranopterin phosphate synthase
MKLSHVDGAGRAHMVDVSAKPRVRRTARAAGRISLASHTVGLIRDNQVEKGDVLAAARIAGIAAAKRTAELIPLCHNLAIDQVEVDLRLEEGGVAIESRAVCTDRTGIEMEALTAVAVAALTVYDMCKAVDRSMSIGEIRLLEKTKQALGEGSVSCLSTSPPARASKRRRWSGSSCGSATASSATPMRGTGTARCPSWPRRRSTP